MINDLINNITASIESGTIGGYVSLGVVALVAVLGIIGLLLGMLRGFGKSGIRLLTVVASAVGAFMLSGSISNWLFGFIEARTPEQVIMSFYPDYNSLGENIRGIINSIDVATLENILALVLCIVILPIVFVVLFLIFNAIAMLFYWLFSGLMALTSFGRSPASTIGGALIGMVQGVFIALVILFPMAELSVVATDIKDELTAESVSEEMTENINSFYEANLDLVITNPVFKGIHKLGGGGLYNSLTTTTIHGVSYSMTEQAEDIAKLTAHIFSLKGMDYKAPTAENKATIDAIISDIDNSPYIAEMLTGTMRTLGTVVDAGFFSVNLGELVNDVVHTTVVVFKTSTPETLHNDLVTIKEVYYVLADYDLLNILTSGDSDAIAKALSSSKPGESSPVNKIIALLDANDHTRPIVSTITKISLSVMAQSTGMAAEEMEELYNNVQTGVTNILSIEFAYNPDEYETIEEYKEVYTEQISTELEQTLSDNGITGVDQETIDEMASIITEKNIERQENGQTEITDQDINDAILSYYEAYAQKHGLSGDISQDFPGGIPGMDDNTEGDENTEE